MKKSILNIGKELNKKELKETHGGIGGVFFDTCSGYTTSWECLRNPECAWGGGVCYTKTPHIV